MRFFAPLIVACAAFVAAQTSTTSSSKENQISIPTGGLQVAVGENTIKWTNPSSGTVTIKLQQAPNITPSSGYVLASGVPASAGTATFNIPADIVNSHEYVYEIIDDSDPSNYNFSNNFGITGGTGTGLPSSSTASAAASSASSASASSASVTSSVSSAAASSSASAASSTSSASSSSASSSSSSSASSSSAQSTPTSVTGSASFLSVNGGIAALVAGAVLVF